MRNFSEWLSSFRDSVSDYGYYCDFEKICKNAEELKRELCLLNSLIGSKNIEVDFENIIADYPNTLKCIPILLAVREREIYAMDCDGELTYSFDTMNQSLDQYKTFMRKTGLFDLLANHILSNLFDYVTGVETGLDTNTRKNRGGKIMENLVESYLNKAGLVNGKTYFKEMKSGEITQKWGIDLSDLTNEGKTQKKFDFVVKTKSVVYGIETNFYSSSGSKLNETARSYKMIALESSNIDGFEFVWITDGKGWNSARNNLEETFNAMPHLYNISDLENGIISQVFL